MMKTAVSERYNSANEKRYYPISNCNWEPDCDVKASFSMQHDENYIYLDYLVEEYYVKGKYRNYSEPLYEDSCVEFFVSFDRTNYYNLEFNCIGNILGAYGQGRENRVLLNDEILTNIKTFPSLGFNRIEIIARQTKWNLQIEIPKETFIYDRINSFVGLKAAGNFYKCGDKLFKPHYLSWNPILTEKPDFHRSEYFGSIEFE